jgi:hypothetical protein
MSAAASHEGSACARTGAGNADAAFAHTGACERGWDGSSSHDGASHAVPRTCARWPFWGDETRCEGERRASNRGLGTGVADIALGRRETEEARATYAMYSLLSRQPRPRSGEARRPVPVPVYRCRYRYRLFRFINYLNIHCPRTTRSRREPEWRQAGRQQQRGESSLRDTSTADRGREKNAK